MAKELTQERIEMCRHSLAHIMAQAVVELIPGTKLAIGPAIADGFYYDFDAARPITEEDFEPITGRMEEIIKSGETFTRDEMSRGEALLRFADEPYKTELISDLPEGESITLYSTGDNFFDLCRGPHVENSRELMAWGFQLMSVTGAYWRGDENRPMLQRVYAYAFPDKKALKAYIAEREEAKKRDHNKLGRELEYFTTTDYIGQGLPILLPKGTMVMRTLQRFVEDEEERRGYLQTMTPLLAKRELYKISGHWDHYRDGMFIMGAPDKFDDESEEILALRPMTCPFQFQAYLNRMRSYRDLPLRYNETSTLFRKESSGEMHGLIRVRQFTISEGHLACRPDQLEREFAGCVDLAKFMLETLGLDGDVTYRFSKWDEHDTEKYIGDKEDWESAQDLMRRILDDIGIDYTEADGEAAFYGPKLDIQIKNVFGKEDTLITIQVDFQLAERFGMEYVDADGSRKHPYVIHRTSIGCYERTLALLIEKYAGALPMWLMSEQVRVLPITDRHTEASQTLRDRLRSLGVRAACDSRNEKIGFKIREARMERIPYMLVLGDKELEDGTVSVRSRNSGDLGAEP
ncbi:MAG: threonine--tRNA ligase, partial [Oscillospiraceae bacterium]|nr:threonine--tRNA ligase [Oscillospiraceae bacterium]